MPAVLQLQLAASSQSAAAPMVGALGTNQPRGNTMTTKPEGIDTARLLADHDSRAQEALADQAEAKPSASAPGR